MGQDREQEFPDGGNVRIGQQDPDCQLHTPSETDVHAKTCHSFAARLNGPTVLAQSPSCRRPPRVELRSNVLRRVLGYSGGL